ncbi:E3 ubiquitin-protein ligase TRIM11-like [Takifugu rubripes]|uniref:E3 ubiquitin-protein ligase TRIM11-like n=1 Tax=Takifugu rubripes TaxID=31033 RepID=A0A674PNH0_TAKRU|nr:E3 ubiquitin-protein ligase TRIM11-like [Takifugu rubripes]
MESKLEETLTCSVCQEIFEDPRQLPCGHSMCLGCLENLRDHCTDVPFRCPNCRKYFGPYIGISKSFTLTTIVEDYQEIRRRKGAADRRVCCDCCPDQQNPAVKTCLKCEVSLCGEHVKDHLERPAFADHPLAKPLREISKRKCPVHKEEVARHYCENSRRYVCHLCVQDSNQQNLTKGVSALLKSKLSEHLTHVDERLEMMKHQVRESNQSIKTLQEDMRRERETAKEKAYPPESPANSITVLLLVLWLMVLVYAYDYAVENQALKEAQQHQQNHINHMYSTITEKLVDRPVNSHFPPVTKDKEVLMLDLDTANDYVKISDDLRTAQKVRTRIRYPSRPNRFEEAPQVLSSHCFGTGAHTWEVEVEGYWDVAVSFRGIKHERNSRSAFGNNPHSWSLTHNGSGKLVAYHDGKKTVVPARLQSNRIAVMVDFEKGNITFASVGSTATRLHEFKAKLTQPVCLGLGLYRVDPPSIASIVNAW